MSTFIHNIATAVPPQSYAQTFLRDQMKEYLGDREITQRIIHRIYSKSGIKKRHTVIRDFEANGDARLFFQPDGSLSMPSTGTRNQIYTEVAKSLFVETARKTIAQNPRIDKTDITHIITVSCTGFFAPEPGFEIINQLGLEATTDRYHIGFMGCFAAFPAMRMARSFCASQPNATVLVVCLELCTLHLQDSTIPDHLISASVFADGAAGMIISSHPPTGSALRFDEFSTSIAHKTEQEMTWTIGDTGFEMMLSSYVPEIIQSNLASALQPLFSQYDCQPGAIEHWAVHPGGRAILDKIEQNFELSTNQLAASRTVLANYGNMSSATILFVLDELMQQPQENPHASILAMAFGPGLTIESALLTKTNA
ncbi:type III polyketide synthase [Fodinibius sediminis]|uniref:Predicted naringenin-chalcone synthase n=1 Tax=Fodinibius sediminis TaxID=1214077 RepID=A0A521CN40_9BACT|nr:type III polyketide synthase [Fodinibius sediminis]SMO60862.1 Predicted naringenin-chalcone synthase [Fodinibius sediminis]